MKGEQFFNMLHLPQPNQFVGAKRSHSQMMAGDSHTFGMGG